MFSMNLPEEDPPQENRFSNRPNYPNIIPPLRRDEDVRLWLLSHFDLREEDRFTAEGQRKGFEV